MRSYVQFFFGCRDCANHFEQMAAASMHQVRSPSSAVLWLWTSHNRVNARLSGKEGSLPRLEAASGGHTDCHFQWHSASYTHLPALLTGPVSLALSAEETDGDSVRPWCSVPELLPLLVPGPSLLPPMLCLLSISLLPD